MMNTALSVASFVCSELERFILSHEHLVPGVKLAGKIIEIKKDGKALIDFESFRALAEIKFPIKVGKTLNVIVIAREPKLKLQLAGPSWSELIDMNV